MIGQKGFPAVQGGIERHVHDVAIRLVSYGFKPTVYSRKWYTGTTKTQVIDGVKVQYLPTIHSKNLDAIVHTFFATFHAILTRQHIMHYHGIGPALLSWIPRILSPGTRVVVTMHGLDHMHAKWGRFARFMLRLGERAAYRFAHKTITVSDELTQYLKRTYGVETVSIPNGVPLFERLKSEDTLKKYGLVSGEYFLLVSRLVPNKGVQHAIEAFLALTDIEVPDISKMKLVIVGDGSYTDDYVHTLKTLAAADPDRVIFTGFVSGKPLDELYSHATLLIHPSYFEGLSLTVLEAMSYSLPVIATRIPALMQLIDNEVYLIDAESSISLQDTLIAVMRLRQFDREREGFRNRKKIEQMYNCDYVVQELVGVYSSLAREKVPVLSSSI